MIKGIIHTPDTWYISAREAYSMAADISLKSWQWLWDNEFTGRYTHERIPTAETKLISIQKTQAFPTVECYYMTLCYNKTVIDVVHHCLLFVTVEQRRSQLNIFCCDVIIIQEYEINWLTILNIVWIKQFTTTVTESLLLAPSLEKNFRKSDCVYIKECLFDIISSSNRKI